MARTLAAGAQWTGTGRLSGWLYDAGGYPGLVQDARAPAVTGDLFAMHDPTAMLDILDDYEEAGPHFPTPQEYARAILSITTDQGDVPAWAYLYNWPVDGMSKWTLSII